MLIARNRVVIAKSISRSHIRLTLRDVKDVRDNCSWAINLCQKLLIKARHKSFDKEYIDSIGPG